MLYEDYVGKDWTKGSFVNSDTGNLVIVRKLEDDEHHVVDGKFVYEEDATCEFHYNPLPIAVQQWNQVRLPDQDDYSYGWQRGSYTELENEYIRLQSKLAHPPHTRWFVWEEDGCTETVCELGIIELAKGSNYEWKDAQ